MEDSKIPIEDLRRNLAKRIKEEGEVVGEDFLKVDSFLNHQIDPGLMMRIAEAIAENFKEEEITKVVTAEAGGNIVAYATSIHLGEFSPEQVPVIYAKKGIPKTMKNPATQRIESATKGEEAELALSKDYLGEGDRVLIVDDFLYTGMTSEALAKLVKRTGASVVGFAFIVSKRNFGGHERLKNFDIPIFVLVEVTKLDFESDNIEFGKGLDPE